MREWDQIAVAVRNSSGGRRDPEIEKMQVPSEHDQVNR